MRAAAGRRSFRTGWILSSLILALGVPSTANAQVPSNDNFADRTVISALPYADSLNTDWASYEEGEPEPPCGYGVGATVWYEYTPATDSVVSVDTGGSSFDTTIAVWTGDQLENLDMVACNEDVERDGFFSSQGRAFFPGTAGTPYMIQIGGYAGWSGDLVLNVEPDTRGSISGTVLKSNGQPPYPICVYAYTVDTSSDYARTSITGPRGRYFIGGLTDGAYKVLFWDCTHYDFADQWYGGASSWEESQDVMVSNSSAVTGIDATIVHDGLAYLEVIVGGMGSVTTDPAGIECGYGYGSSYCYNDLFEWDSVVTLTATPAPGQDFLGWTGCDSSAGNTCEVEMGYSRWVHAQFTEPRPEPNTSIWYGPQEFGTGRSATFEFYSDAYPARFECSLDGAGFEQCTSPAELDDIPDGEHVFRVRALDELGGVDQTPARWRWTVDNTAPELTVERPTAGVYVNNMSVGGTGPIVVVGMVSVEVKAVDDLSGIGDFQFEVNGTPIQPQGISVDEGLYRFVFKPTQPGVYDIRARAFNRAGLSSSTSFQVTGIPAG